MFYEITRIYTVVVIIDFTRNVRFERLSKMNIRETFNKPKQTRF